MSERQKIIDDLSMFGNAFAVNNGNGMKHVDIRDIQHFYPERVFAVNWWAEEPFMGIRKRKTLDQIKEIVKLKK